MRLAPILPALIIAFAAQGPAQNTQPLPPSVQPAPGLMTAPATSPASPGAPAPNAVTSVNTSGQVTSSTSATKQFIVYGADLQTRGSFCLLCEDIANDLGRLLKDDGRFALPIVVVLKTPPNINLSQPAITYSFSQLAYGGFHLQINAELRRDFNAEDFSRELVRMLLAERILRNHKEVQTTRSKLLSGWLLTGVTQAMEFRSRSRPSALFAAVFRSGQVYSIDRIIEANPNELDALARGIYETSSCALVLALLDQADGGVRFSRFLSALANGKKGDRELLKEHFPTLGVSKNSLEKWWTLQMASLATPGTFESMTYLQTEEALVTALTFRAPDQESGSRPSSSHARTEATPPPAPVETPAEKKSRGWFRFGRKDKESGEPETEEKKTEGAPEATKSQPAPATPAAPVAPVPPAGTTPPAPAEPEKPAEKKGFFNFSGGRKVAAPIKRNQDGIDGQASAQPAAAQPAAAQPAPAQPSTRRRGASRAAAPAPAAAAPTNAAPANTAASAPATATPPVEEKKKPRGFRDLFNKKKAEAQAATPDPVPAPAPAPTPAPPARRPQVRRPAPATVEKTEEKKAAEKPEKKSEADKPAETMPEAKPDGETDSKTASAPALDPDFMGPPAPAKPEAPKPVEEKPEIAMPVNAGERKPDEPLPPGLTPVPPAPGDPAMASPQMPPPLPFLPEPTPAPPDVAPDKQTNLPALGQTNDPDLLPLEDFARLAKRKDRSEILKRTLNHINSVKLRAHPLYRPLIGDYATVVQNLILGRETGVSDQLAAIRKQHLEIRERARAVETYVDWYEASQTQTYSHVFDDYLKLRDDLDKDVIPRSDAVSRYLDAIQKEFEE